MPKRISKPLSADKVIDLVPEELLTTLTSRTDVDYGVKKLTGKLVFRLFLFAILSAKTISLRILQTFYNADKFKELFNPPKATITHAGIGSRLAKINSDFFQQIFEYLISLPQLDSVLLGGRRVAVNKIDTTIVTLSSKLLKFGLDDNPGHKTLKFGVTLSGGIPVNLVLFSGQEYLSEDNALPELILKKSQKQSLNIAIFDRGVQRKQNFVDFKKAGIHFISRLSTQKVKVIRRQPLAEKQTATLTILSDQIIRFKSSENLKPEDADTEFRLVIGKNKNTDQEIQFLTNVNFLSAVEIANLYKSRWEIETFFKFIKQELNFSHLLSRNENGIRVVMYLTMIVALLLTLYKQLNKIVGWAVAKIQFIDELETSVRRQMMNNLKTILLSAHLPNSPNSQLYGYLYTLSLKEI